MAFWRISPDEPTKLQRAPSRVFAPTFTLRRTNPSDRSRTDEPDGWRWFDTAAEAVAHFGLESFKDYRRRREIEIVTELGIDFQQEYRDLILGGDDS